MEVSVRSARLACGGCWERGGVNSLGLRGLVVGGGSIASLGIFRISLVLFPSSTSSG